MEIRVQGYESQVKLFLVLLALFLVAVGVVGLNALYRSQALLVQEAEGRIVSSSRAVQRELIEQAGARAPRLKDLARAYSISSIEIVDREGRVIHGTEPWRIGVTDPVAEQVCQRDLGRLDAGAAVIQEPVGTTKDPGDSEYGPDRGEVYVFLALEKEGSGSASLLKVGHEVLGVRTVARQIRTLAWIQAIAGLVVLALAMLFVRWVLRPYRALKAAALQIGEPPTPESDGRIDDPHDLIASFRGVIGKLKDQERELERMRALARPGGPSPVSRELLDGLTSGVLIIGAGGSVTALNPAGEAILGMQRDRIVGRDFRDVFAPSQALLQILRDGVEAGKTHSREVVPYAGRPGGQAHLGVTVSSIPPTIAPGGGAFCLFSDLTEIRGLAERVRLKENLAGLGEMSAGIAHEFRNSLATILGYARLIGRRAPDEDRARSRAAEGGGVCGHGDHAGAIVREVESIGRVVEDFLRYARPAALHASQWDPRLVMADVAAQLSRDSERSGITIAIGGEWPGSIRADEVLLRQAFGNLLRNALEAIPSESGLITVTGVLEEGGDQLRIEVADSGIGIPPEVLARLFTPFVTTKQRGTGLGLALAQKAIVSHDGAITARNAESGGACFTVTLPVQI